MKVKTAYSTENNIDSIISDIEKQIGKIDAKLIQFYASSKIDPDQISKRLYSLFGKVPIMGCSSSGEIISGQVLDDSIVVMALGEEIIEDCSIEVLTNIATDKLAVDNAFKSFQEYYKSDLSELDPHKYVGIVLIDGLSGQEERINERIGDLTNITFIGGSAGDDLKFERTFVYANGKYYSDAAVLTLIKSKAQFDILKTQSFTSTNKQVVVTKADEPNRTVIELNGKPAIEEYASLLGISMENVENEFASHPLGVVFEEDFFVRSPQKRDNEKIVFYCSIKEGMELDILESGNIIDKTGKDLDAKIESFGAISAIINFNCILRTLEMKNKNQTKAYGELFKDIPTVGFSTYGESYIGHINQTATMLLFK